MSENPIETLAELLRGVDVQIGLRQQGHIETVDRMLAEGATWNEIGVAIHWHGPTAKQWYEIESKRTKELGTER